MRYSVQRQWVVIDTAARKPNKVVATAWTEGDAYKLAYKKEAAHERASRVRLFEQRALAHDKDLNDDP